MRYIIPLFLVACVRQPETTSVPVVDIPQTNITVLPKKADLDPAPSFGWRVEIDAFVPILHIKDPFRYPDDERKLIENEDYRCVARRRTISTHLEIAELECEGFIPLGMTPASETRRILITAHTPTVPCGDYIVGSAVIFDEGFRVALVCENRNIP